MRLFTLAGIPVRVHPLLLVAFSAVLVGTVVGFGWRPALAAAVALLGLSLSVLVHELGHALVAKTYGIATHHITLHLFGGVTALEREARDPSAEVAIAVAGPLGNAVLAVLAVPAAVDGGLVARWFVGINVVMGLFNLIPAFPMDGGRILRGVCSAQGDRVRATRVALQVSGVFAIGMLVLGVIWMPTLAMAGAFLLVVNLFEQWQHRRFGHLAS